MKFDQDLCGTSDMNSTLGSVVRLAMFFKALQTWPKLFQRLPRFKTFQKWPKRSSTSSDIQNLNFAKKLAHNNQPGPQQLTSSHQLDDQPEEPNDRMNYQMTRFTLEEVLDFFHSRGAHFSWQTYKKIFVTHRGNGK